MSALKRKSPYGSVSGSPAPGMRGGSAPIAGVKAEGGDVKRHRGLAGTPMSAVLDSRTVLIELRDHLKGRQTMPWDDAYYYIDGKYPGVDATAILELLKKQDNVKFNEANNVYTFEPDLVLKSKADLRSYIRTHSRPTTGVIFKQLKELMPGPELAQFLQELEDDGQVLILRSLTGKLKDAPLPELGRQNAWGEKINAGGQERWRVIFWDDLKERGRAASRVDDEFVFAWADVKIAETDDVARLLEEQDLKASSTSAPPPKMTIGDKDKKKKPRRRALKITNSHMKALGVDFTQDYVPPS